jgi:hypothetical protein
MVADCFLDVVGLTYEHCPKFLISDRHRPLCDSTSYIDNDMSIKSQSRKDLLGTI